MPSSIAKSVAQRREMREAKIRGVVYQAVLKNSWDYPHAITEESLASELRISRRRLDPIIQKMIQDGTVEYHYFYENLRGVRVSRGHDSGGASQPASP